MLLVIHWGTATRLFPAQVALVPEIEHGQPVVCWIWQINEDSNKNLTAKDRLEMAIAKLALVAGRLNWPSGIFVIVDLWQTKINTDLRER